MISTVRTLAVLAFAFLCLLPSKAWAQAGLELSARLSQPVTSVGTPFRVELSAMVPKSEPLPSQPQLSAPSGFAMNGPSIGHKTFVKITNGQTEAQRGISASWELTASSPGTFTIAAPSVLWKGSRRQSRSLQIEVLPAGAPVPGSGFGTMPGFPSMPMPGFPSPPPGFGPSSSPFGPNWPFDDDDDDDFFFDDDDERDGSLSMKEAPDPNLFLRAIADKEKAVIGEQVTISFYIYYRVDFEMTERHEAPMADFLRVGLLTDPGTTAPEFTSVGRQRWGVRLIDRVALFPLRAGELETGSMSARFVGRRIGSQVLREANSVTINVVEPPVDNRPTGYQLGDVGDFSLEASVTPRETVQGGSVGVTLRVRGTGNLPNKLNVPERTGIEWLDPEKKEDIEPRRGRVGGWRSFGYVVTLEESGSVDLGEVELSYYDPDSESYKVATASLGNVQVEPRQPTDEEIERAKADAEQEDDDLLAQMPAPRESLGSFAPSSSASLEGLVYWAGLAVPPGLFGLFWAARTAARARSRRKREREASSERALKVALDDAAAAKKDNKVMLAALERAVYAAIEAGTQLKARGILRADLTRELVDAGLPKELAEEAQAKLDQFEELRFAPGGEDDARSDLLKQTKKLCQRLARAGARPTKNDTDVDAEEDGDE